MKKQSMLRLSVILLATVGAISTASAQTTAQQAQGQVAETAQAAGVTQVAQVQQAAIGGQHIGAAVATPEVAHIQNGQTNPGATQQPCVGPASFCTLYFGS